MLGNYSRGTIQELKALLKEKDDYVSGKYQKVVCKRLHRPLRLEKAPI